MCHDWKTPVKWQVMTKNSDQMTLHCPLPYYYDFWYRYTIICIARDVSLITLQHGLKNLQSTCATTEKLQSSDKSWRKTPIKWLCIALCPIRLIFHTHNYIILVLNLCKESLLGSGNLGLPGLQTDLGGLPLLGHLLLSLSLGGWSRPLHLK